MKQSENLNELAAALVEAQKGMPAIEKDARGHGYDYASLDNIMGRIRPVLASHGLTIIQAPTNRDAQEMGLTTRLLHTSGQWVEETVYAPRDEGKRRNSVQAAGSTITYLRRYGIAALLGLADETDTDGQPTKARNKQKPAPSENGGKQPAMPDDNQRKGFHATGKECYGDDWDTKRAELVESITKGRTKSSNDLTAAEMATITRGMRKKITERKQEA